MQCLFKIIFNSMFLLLLLIGCGDAPPIGEPQPEEMAAISAVLKRWRVGYETEDVEMYMSAFWAEGFRWVSDMGTDQD